MDTKSYPLTLFIFRRDLRLHDNAGLIAALQASQQVIPCFIFDPRQIEHNDYKTENGLQFMAHSLRELNEELQTKQSQLYLFYGHAEEVVARLVDELRLAAVYVNRDYTPFSIHRDQKIAKICAQHAIAFHSFADALLHEPEQVEKSDHTPYTVFTPFFHKASTLAVERPRKNDYSNYYQKTIPGTATNVLNKLLSKNNPNILVSGGRKEAKHLLKKLADLKDYANTRNIPALTGTTHLSAHNKFGTVSIREVYYVINKLFGPKHTLITELYWRDFFTHVAFHYPTVFGKEFHQKYSAIRWAKDETQFRAWCEGQTGFPIVDAGMRELNSTGYMHNRVRMITASFLVKDLHLDWRLGEKYFAQKLTDYDPAVNNGNWQWAASTGCDAQPYFRIFNPWLQQEKYDPDCLYIKRWIPELAKIAPEKLHAIQKYHSNLNTNYPKQIIDHAIESAKAKQIYKMTT